MKERVTLTIEKEILERIDEKVDGSKIKNRSHAVELMLQKALSSNRPRKAVILAGGNEPAAMKIVQNKPLIEWNIELLKMHGVKEIMLCIGKDNPAVKQHFGEGSRMGVKISYFEEEYPLGTAGSIKAVADFIRETTIVCNADELKNIDLDDMYEFHKDNNKGCTIALTTIDDPSQYGVAMLNGLKIVAFVEKPSKEKAPSNLVNAGLYIIEPDILKYIPDGFAMLEQDVFPKLAKEDKLFGYIFSGQWFSSKNGHKDTDKLWKGF